MSLAKLQRRDEHRLQVLRTLYEVTNGSGAVCSTLTPSDLELTLDEYRAAAAYLCGEGLVVPARASDLFYLALTNAGINEVESTIRNPGRRTGHFEPVVINIVSNYFENSNIGAVQVDGTGNSAEVVQSVKKDAQ